MPFDRASLPRDPDRLIEIIIELQERTAHLQGMVDALKRVVYGPRSEKLIADPGQLPLELDDVELSEKPAAANDDDVDQRPAKPRPPRPKAVRNIGALPKHLPRCEVMIEPESTVCPSVAARCTSSGEDVSEQLDVIPAVIQVKRFRRPRYGCRSCEGAVVQAKAPPRLVENGMATALVTSIVVGKFAWHLLLNRQTHMLRGHGIDLDRSTLVHWVLRAAWWLKPLYMLLVDFILAAPKVFCDDTPLPVLDRRRRRTRTARLWSYAIPGHRTRLL